LEAGVRRFVHISSASVQGRLDPLDETSRHLPLSPYGRSKAAGEQALFDAAAATGAAPGEVVVYRPTSVHAPGRPATRALARLAVSLPAFPLGGAGDQAVPVALIGNVASGILHAANMTDPPVVVLQPWEGVTSRELLELFGGRRFVRLPERAVRAGVLLARRTQSPSWVSRLRWLELTLAGQGIRAEALAATGFVPPLGRGAWFDMVEQHRILGDPRPGVAGAVADGLV
jgi:nucleoside-diphosphate-sugar epimerase